MYTFAEVMPFDNNSFDVVWTQHASMNIADKSRLYSEMYRVLKPNEWGWLVIYDIFKGPKKYEREGDNNNTTTTTFSYPGPWASNQSLNLDMTATYFKDLIYALYRVRGIFYLFLS